MERLMQTDWSVLFRLEMSLPEILVRGTLVYIVLCLLLRIVLKRQAGRVSLSDLLSPGATPWTGSVTIPPWSTSFCIRNRSS
jgi:hypothetical protein